MNVDPEGQNNFFFRALKLGKAFLAVNNAKVRI